MGATMTDRAVHGSKRLLIAYRTVPNSCPWIPLWTFSMYSECDRVCWIYMSIVHRAWKICLVFLRCVCYWEGGDFFRASRPHVGIHRCHWTYNGWFYPPIMTIRCLSSSLRICKNEDVPRFPWQSWLADLRSASASQQLFYARLWTRQPAAALFRSSRLGADCLDHNSQQ